MGTEGRARCLNLRKVDLDQFPQKYDSSFDPSGWRIQDEHQKPCEIKGLPTINRSCAPCSQPLQSSGEETSCMVKCRRAYSAFRLPPLPPENCFPWHSRFSETLLGYLDMHDYGGKKYYRNFQAKHDLNIIQRLMSCNLCKNYPDETIRYFALNWPECCIMVSFPPNNISSCITCFKYLFKRIFLNDQALPVFRY